MLKAWVLILPLFAGCVARVADVAHMAVQRDFDGEFDWPQWQGPERDAASKETGLLQSWPENGPALVWKATGCGEGFVTPSVAAGRIFLMGNIDLTEFVICLDERNGKTIWRSAIGPVRSDGGGYPGPRCTPTIDGERLYALGLNGDLVCLKAADGKEHWRKDLCKEFEGQPGQWGFSESPLVDGNKLLVTPGGKENSMVALDKTSGKLIWSAKVPEGDQAAYASIIAADVAGQRQYIQFLSHGVVGIAAVSGKFLWRYDNPANGIANCSTVLFRDNHVFAASSYSTGGGLAKLTRTGDETKAEQVYFTEKMQNHHGGIVLVRDHVYGSNEGQVCCLKFLTGEIMWQSKEPGKGSIGYADGCIYYRNQGGKLFLFEANSQKYVQRGAFTPSDLSKQPAWAHPVIANGRMYIADQDALLCYDVKRKQE